MATNFLAARNSNLSSFNVVSITYSTIRGSTIASVSTMNVSTIVNSNITAVGINYSTLVGSSIVTNAVITQSLAYSTLTGSSITGSALTVGNIQGTSVSASTITTTGNVGIGMTNPSSMLHVNGGITTTSDVTTQQVNALSVVTDFGLGFPRTLTPSFNGGWVSMGFNNPSGLPTTSYNTASLSLAWNYSGSGEGEIDFMNNYGNGGFNFYKRTGASSAILLTKISPTGAISCAGMTTTGNVGIGTATVNAPLQFANTTANRKIVLYETTNNDHQYFGFGVNANILRYQVDATSVSHVFYAGTSSTTSNELMRISGNGNVGIGITNPSSMLHVNGTTTFGNGNGSSNYNTNAGTITAPTSSGQVSGATVTNNYGTVLNISGGNLNTSVRNNANFGGDVSISAGDMIDTGNTGVDSGIYVGGGIFLRSGRVAVNNVAGNTQTVIPGSIYFQIGSGSRNTSSSLGGYNTAMMIDSNGNVGIGTQSPFGILQIACTTGTNQANSPDGGAGHGLVFTSPKTGSSVYAMAMGVDFTTGYGYINGAGNSAFQPILLQSRGGNVGIGTVSPSAPLHIYANTSNILTLDSSLGPTYMSFSANGAARALIGIDNSAGEGLFGSNVAYGLGIGTLGNTPTIFVTNNAIRMTIASNGNVSISGSLSKGSGTFDIEHPLYPNTNRRLVHSFIEGPRCDLIYRGIIVLTNGSASVYIDKQCTYAPENAMDDGTFEALCVNPQYFLQNMSGFNRVIGSIYRGILTITCENNTATDTISWMVVAERKDPFVKNWDRTDSNGYLNTQYIK